MTSPQDPPVTPPTVTGADRARFRTLINQAADTAPYTDAEIDALMQATLCVTPLVDPITRLPMVDARLLGLVAVHLDLYGAAALVWEDKAIAAQAAEAGSGVVQQEQTGQNSVTYAKDSSGSAAMWTLARRMRRRSCNPSLTKAKTITVLTPSVGIGYGPGFGPNGSNLDYVTSTELLGDPMPIGITDPAVINGPPLGQ